MGYEVWPPWRAKPEPKPATKEQCRRLWTSFGVFVRMLPYLGTMDQTWLQALNQFCYKVAVSRVQSTCQVQRPSYFGWWAGFNSKNVVYKLDSSRLKPFRIKNARLDLQSYLTVQVGSDVYGFQHRDTDARLVQYTGLSLGAPEIKAIERAKPLRPRGYPSLVNFQDRFIFVSGGEDLTTCSVTSKEYLSSTDVFDVAKNEWRRAPRLNQPRANHSTCVLGDFLYTCCGSGGTGKLASIEAFDAASFVQGKHKIRWTVLEHGCPLLTGRNNPLMASIGADKIFIFGGWGEQGCLGDGFVLSIELLHLNVERVVDGAGESDLSLSTAGN